MFDELVAEATGASGGGAVGAWARLEAAACARRLAEMVVMLDARHAADGSGDREQWCLDNWGALSAEIGAAQQISTGAASHQLIIATALRDRLPKVAEVFAAGLATYRVIAAIVFRTMLIRDPDALCQVDRGLAVAIREWEPMSAEKLTAAIDCWVNRYDPHAVRRTASAARSRSVEVFTNDADGLSHLSSTLFTLDAEALDRRLDALADTVCDADPRTKDQRRADALGALALGVERLACRCEGDDCPATDPGAQGSAPAGGVTIHVVVNEDTLDDDTPEAVAQDAALDGESPPMFGKPLRELTWNDVRTHRDTPEWAAARPGTVMGGPLLGGALIRRAALNAAIKRIFHPGQAPPEPRYTPSARLADFVRCRDLSCRFPGCNEPATNCDVDHTIAHPVGPTQASNLKCLCRFHHLLKTFWGGIGGWRDRQLPDGTVIWTGPDGYTYTTRPGSVLLFPALCVPTAPVAPATLTAAAGEQKAHTAGLTMPRRTRTRAADRARRIEEERRLNETQPDSPTAPIALPPRRSCTIPIGHYQESESRCESTEVIPF